ncbi:unnamed protein product, partial [Allacma fusca]
MDMTEGGKRNSGCRSVVNQQEWMAFLGKVFLFKPISSYCVVIDSGYGSSKERQEYGGDDDEGT